MARRPPATGPGGSPKEGAAPDERRRPRLRTRLTGRAAVLVLALCAVGVALAYPLRNYLAQQNQLTALRDQIRQQQDAVHSLQQQDQAWQDPAYVRAQARQLLHYADPGETPFVVLPSSALPVPPAAPTPVPTAAAQAWYQRLIGSADVARGPVGTPTPPPPPPPPRPAPKASIGPTPRPR